MATLTLGITGFDIPEATFIQTSVDLASGMDIGHWVVVNNEEADVILVNTETLSCQEAITQYAASGHQKEGLFIDCSKTCRKSSAATLSLKRPITYPALVSLLTELQTELKNPTRTATPAKIIKPAQKKNSIAIPRPLPPPQESPSIIVSKILKDLPTQEFSLEKESAFSEESTTEVEYLDIKEENTIDISDLFKTAKVSVLNDIVRPSDTQAEQIKSPSRSLKPLPRLKARKVRHSALHSVDNVHFGQQQPQEGNARDLLLLDRPARRFYEATRFLGILKSAIEKNQAIEVTHYQFPALRIYPDQKTYAIPQNNDLPIKMFRTLAVEFSSQRLTKMSERDAPVDWLIKPLWQLLFIAALYGSEGRLIEGAQLSDKLKLISEPDYNIVPEKPEYEAITRTIQTYNTIDLKTLADKTGVKIETVIDFCNACEEARLIKRIALKKASNSLTKPHHRPSLYRSADNKENEPSDLSNPGLVKRIKSIFKHSE